MLQRVKDLLAKYKVHVTVAGGALVVATALGTCYFDPSEVSDDNSTDVVPVSTETAGTTTTETAGTTTTETAGTTTTD